MEEITATELKQRLDNGDDIQIVDVREDNEFAYCAHTELYSYPAGPGVDAHERDRSKPRNGRPLQDGRTQRARDRRASAFGFQGKLINLKGGILGWSDEVDPSVPKY